MGTPRFVLDLRKAIGTDLLTLVGVVGVIQDQDNNVLLNQRSDSLEWAPIMGVVEPEEEPASALVREISEETNVLARIDSIAGVIAQPATSYRNGDKVQFTDIVFACTYVSGNARVNDNESTDVRWFQIDDLPAMSEQNMERVRIARRFNGATYFRR